MSLTLSDKSIPRYRPDENMLLARQLNDKERELKIQLELSYLLSSIGMYMEAADILNSIDRQTLPSSLLGYYYTCYEHVYFEAGAAQPRYKMFASRYAKLSHAYRDSDDSVRQKREVSFVLLFFLYNSLLVPLI